MSDPTLERRASNEMLLILGAAAIVSLFFLLRPFLLPVAIAGALAVLVHPVHVWILARTGRPSLVAGVLTLFVAVFAVVPATALVAGLLASLAETFQGAAANLGEDQVGRLLTSRPVERLADLLSIRPDQLPGLIETKLKEQAGPIADHSLRIVSGFGAGIVDFSLIVFSLFFLLRDGPALIEKLVWLAPLDRARTERLMGKARDAIFATVYGSLGVAVAQGLLGWVGFLFAGLPSPTFWAVVMAFMSLAPLLGSTLIWLPAAIYVLIQIDPFRGLALIAWGVVVISSVDNFVRAWLVGGRTELHPLAVFLCVLGGVALFGAAGVLLGPVLFVVAVATLEMVRSSLDEEPAPAGLLAESAGSEPDPVPD